MICPNCGRETPGKFCPICGTKLVVESVPPASEAVRQTAPEVEPVRKNEPSFGSNQNQYNAPSQEFAPAQGYAPNPDYAPNSGYAPRQDYAPNQSFAPNPGYAPDQNYAPNPGYVPNQNFSPNWNYAPNQSDTPNPEAALGWDNAAGFGGQGYNADYSYNQNANPGFVPSQGYNPGPQVIGGYQDAPPDALGQTPASRLVRKLASSPLYVLATILTTLAFGVSLYFSVMYVVDSFQSLSEELRWMDYWKGTAQESFYRDNAIKLISNIAASGLSALMNLLMVISLWNIFASARNKRREQMATGGFRCIRFLAVLTILGTLLCLGLVSVLLAMLITADTYSDFFKQAINEMGGILTNGGVPLDDLLKEFELRTFLFILLGTVLVGILLVAIYWAKVFKSLGIAKTVVKTGVGDDRVSVYVALGTFLVAGYNVYGGVILLAEGSATEEILSAVAMFAAAIAGVFFAITLFQFRSGMRKLGFHHGVATN